MIVVSAAAAASLVYYKRRSAAQNALNGFEDGVVQNKNNPIYEAKTRFFENPLYRGDADFTFDT